MGILTQTQTHTCEVPLPPTRVWVPTTFLMGTGMGPYTHGYGYGFVENSYISRLNNIFLSYYVVFFVCK